ncbi:peroxidase 70-like [Syzygium oleosum]|uniref:peroxidase 70-like n=1 Tax=Syzygium oleosum TaxID=219896 RepID=UPI0011D2990D|nr:peroxidase 70-like [Syzygium oleosum]
MTKRHHIRRRDSTTELGGPRWKVWLGRRDFTESRDDAQLSLPSPFLYISSTTKSFTNQRLAINDLVIQSSARAPGYARCAIFRGRIYNDTNIAPTFTCSLQLFWPPLLSNESDPRLAALDPTAAVLDTSYNQNLLQQKGCLHSDKAFLSDPRLAELVKSYSDDRERFWRDFPKSVVKMGNIKP